MPCMSLRLEIFVNLMFVETAYRISSSLELRLGRETVLLRWIEDLEAFDPMRQDVLYKHDRLVQASVESTSTCYAWFLKPRQGDSY